MKNWKAELIDSLIKFVSIWWTNRKAKSTGKDA